MSRAIFLDRDGVIIRNRDDYVRSWTDVEFIPGAIDAISRINKINYKVVIATNQAGVGRGLMTLETANLINEKIVEAIRSGGGQIDRVYMCPHSPHDQCSCRKPKPGMLISAANELTLSLNQSWMIGDAWTDLETGANAGTRGICMVKTGRGTHQLTLPKPNNIKDYFVFSDLSEAVDTICQVDNAENSK